MRTYLYIISLLIIFTANACKDPYHINIEPTDLDVLVVEGQITGPESQSFVSITRSLNVNDHSSLRVEHNATVYVEDEANNRFQLQYDPSTLRYQNQINTVVGNKYRMTIETIDGKSYVSTYNTLLNTPAIDEINYERVFDGLAIKLNTEDPTEQTKFYRWTFQEDWEINSVFMSNVYYDDSAVRLIDSVVLDAYFCYKQNKSTSILLGSIENFSNSKLVDHIIHKIPSRDDRISVRYSIEVKQYALSKDGFFFLDLMKKNTESLGSIFDPQPSESVGNVICISDPETKVLGYIEASVEQTKRIYITSSDVPEWGFIQTCFTYDVPDLPDSMRYYFPGMYLPLENVSPIPSATSTCVDCRLRGGNNNRPDFW